MRRKTRLVNRRFCLLPSIYGEIAAFLWVVDSRERCISSAFTAETRPRCTTALVAAAAPATPEEHHVAPRRPARPALRRAPEVDGRHDAPRRVDLEPREQVHGYETRRGRRAAFFLRPRREAATPSSRRKQAVPPPTPSSRSFTQAGTTAPCPRRATRRPRRLEDSWLPKGSSSTSPSLLR